MSYVTLIGFLGPYWSQVLGRFGHSSGSYAPFWMILRQSGELFFRKGFCHSNPSCGEQLSTLTKHRLTWRKHELCHFEGFSWTPPQNIHPGLPIDPKGKPSRTPRQKPMENRFWDVLGHSSGSYAPFWTILRQSREFFFRKGLCHWVDRLRNPLKSILCGW